MLSSNIKSEKISAADHSKRSRSHSTDLGDILPHDKMAEQAVLGAIIIHNAILPQILDIINTGDFFSPANQYIFSAKILHNAHQCAMCAFLAAGSSSFDVIHKNTLQIRENIPAATLLTNI